MKGYIKCDICGKFYEEADNERYDGLAVFFRYGTDNSERTFLAPDENIVEADGSDSCIPASMDMCTDCFNRFVDWVKACRADYRHGLK